MLSNANEASRASKLEYWVILNNQKNIGFYLNALFSWLENCSEL